MWSSQHAFISERIIWWTSAYSCDVLFSFFYLSFVNCDFGTSLFFDHENGTQYIYSARLFTDMWLFQGLRVCEQCYGLVLWFLLNTATSLTALLLAINYSLKWAFVLYAFIYFLYTHLGRTIQIFSLKYFACIKGYQCVNVIRAVHAVLIAVQMHYSCQTVTAYQLGSF